MHYSQIVIFQHLIIKNTKKKLNIVKIVSKVELKQNANLYATQNGTKYTTEFPLINVLI